MVWPSVGYIGLTLNMQQKVTVALEVASDWGSLWIGMDY